MPSPRLAFRKGDAFLDRRDEPLSKNALSPLSLRLAAALSNPPIGARAFHGMSRSRVAMLAPGGDSDSDLENPSGPDLAARGQRRMKEREDDDEYNDDLVFDNIKHLLPGAESGRYLLIGSIVLQVAVVVLAFLSHHHKTRDFDCCNMVAVALAAGFLAIQIPYLNDWFSDLGYLPQWHRGNIFVPFVVLVVTLWEWGSGLVSMMAQSIGVDVFEWVNVSDLGFWEGLAFLVCSGCLGVCVVLFFAIDYTHRNNVGNHYYYVEEKAGALIEVSDERVPNTGSFDLVIVQWLVSWLQVANSRSAEHNLPRLITLATILQVPFYLFATIAYTVDRDSTVAPIVIMGIGVLTFVFNWQYFVGAITRRSKKTRSWNRTNLYFPTQVSFTMIVVYFFTMANMFFKTTDQDLHEAIPDLNATERALLWSSVAAISAAVFVQLLLAATHRKVWAEEREMGLGVRDPLEERAAASVFGVAVVDDKAAAGAGAIDDAGFYGGDGRTLEEMVAAEPEGVPDYGGEGDYPDGPGYEAEPGAAVGAGLGDNYPDDDSGDDELSPRAKAAARAARIAKRNDKKARERQARRDERDAQRRRRQAEADAAAEAADDFDPKRAVHADAGDATGASGSELDGGDTDEAIVGAVAAVDDSSSGSGSGGDSSDDDDGAKDDKKRPERSRASRSVSAQHTVMSARLRAATLTGAVPPPSGALDDEAEVQEYHEDDDDDDLLDVADA